MFALADAGFQISLVKRLVGTKHLRILEIGWGQAGCQLSTFFGMELETASYKCYIRIYN